MNDALANVPHLRLRFDDFRFDSKADIDLCLLLDFRFSLACFFELPDSDELVLELVLLLELELELDELDELDELESESLSLDELDELALKWKIKKKIKICR